MYGQREIVNKVLMISDFYSTGVAPEHLKGTDAQLKKILGADKVHTQNAQNLGTLKKIGSPGTKSSPAWHPLLHFSRCLGTHGTRTAATPVL